MGGKRSSFCLHSYLCYRTHIKLTVKFLDLFQNFNQADEFVCFKETQINPCINILIGSAVLYGRLLNKAGFDLTKTKITIDGLTQLQVLAPSHFQL